MHPAVVLSVNALNSRLGHVAVIPITGTKGPDATQIPLTADAGLTRYDESYADITGLRARLLAAHATSAAGSYTQTRWHTLKSSYGPTSASDPAPAA
jgi:mRNA-degrading endonuclease toxin of MazEF toxin-antitoxin module